MPEVKLMIQKIKDKLLALDCSSIGTFLIFLGNLIVVICLCTCVAISYGTIAGTIFLGICLIIMGTTFIIF